MSGDATNLNYREEEEEGDDGQQVEKKKDEQSISTPPFKLGLGALIVLCILYGTFFMATHRSIYTMDIKPLPLDASPNVFSEGRTLKHIWHLAHKIGIRQEGSPGLYEAARYIKSELESYKKRASPNLRVDIDEMLVNGSFNMVFLKHSIGLAYRNHTNIIIRIAASAADDDAAAVLVNGHFDSAIGSPGAGDCASCVAAMLELVRLIIDIDWVPSSPLIFLFNGAEEVFMVACHGFMTSHKWRNSVGVLINVESSGTSGPDLVCQSGPGSWPAEVYAKAAVHPMANSAAQDVFPIFPGDTDYRMFSQDYGNIPGLDIILLLNSYIYHTPYDTPERMAPGSMQVRGENLVSLLRAFTNSSKLLNAKQRAQQGEAFGLNIRRPVFFDFLGRFMIYYPFEVAMALHVLPLSVVLLISSTTSYEACGVADVTGRIYLVFEGLMVHACGMILAIILPIFLAALRLLASSTAMTWFAQPWLACLMFVPISISGMLISRMLLPHKIMLQGRVKKLAYQKKAIEWGLHWGAISYYSIGAALGTYFVVGNGFLSFWWGSFSIISQYMLRLCQKYLAKRSLVLLSLYIVIMAFPILMSLYIGEIVWQVVHEKMGMSGSVPQPYGFFFPDMIMAATTGYVVVLCIGPVIPIVANWMASSHLIRLLIYLSIGSAAISAQFFPYNENAPKRVLLQHTVNTDGNDIVGSRFDLAVLDANSLPFVLKHVPRLSVLLGISSKPGNSFERSPPGTWMALYPISALFTESFRFSAKCKNILKSHPYLPTIHVRSVEAGHLPNSKKTHLELDLGSLNEIWAAVINVTGPLISWSFSDEHLPAPEMVNGGPPSYICRLTGRDTTENWKFWLEAEMSPYLRVDLAVLDQQIEKGTQELINIFPQWAAVIAASGYLSTYYL